MPRAVLLAFALLVLAGCGAGTGVTARDDAAELERALAGRIAGPPQRCIPVLRQGSPQIVGQSLLYRDGRTIWRADVPDCPALSGDPILIMEVFGAEYCDTDRFRTLPRGGGTIPGPFCRFGRFTPYRQPR